MNRLPINPKRAQVTITGYNDKASQVVVLNEDSQLLLNVNSCIQHDPYPQIEFDFVEKHIH